VNRKLVSAAALCAFALFGFGLAHADEKKWKTYDDKDLRYSVDVPEEFTPAPATQGQGTVFSVKGAETFFVVEYKPERKDIEALEKWLRGRFGKVGITVTEGKRTKIDGCQAFRLILIMLKDKKRPKALKEVCVAVDEPHGCFLLEYVDAQKDFDTKTAEKVVASFREYKPPAGK